VINVAVGAGRFKALRRMAWENVMLPREMVKQHLNIYLTFSHYLPTGLDARSRSIVGISNLAPFSAEAWNVESHAVRLKCGSCGLPSFHPQDGRRKLSRFPTRASRSCLAQGVEESKIEVIPIGVDISGSAADPVPASGSPYPFRYISFRVPFSSV